MSLCSMTGGQGWVDRCLVARAGWTGVWLNIYVTLCHAAITLYFIYSDYVHLKRSKKKRLQGKGLWFSNTATQHKPSLEKLNTYCSGNI